MLGAAMFDKAPRLPHIAAHPRMACRDIAQNRNLLRSLQIHRTELADSASRLLANSPIADNLCGFAGDREAWRKGWDSTDDLLFFGYRITYFIE
jgi:hypothetical protein